MAEQTSRLAIILDSTGAKRSADTLATSLERLTTQGEKATGSTDELGFSFKRLAASAAGAMSIGAVIKMADGWGQVAARMKNTLKSVEGDIKNYADKQLDGKFDKSGGVIKGNSGALILQNTVDSGALYLRLERKNGESRGWVGAGGAGNDISLNNSYSGKTLTLSSTGAITYGGNGLLQVGDGGWMKDTGYGLPVTITKLSDYRLNSIGYAYSATQTDAFKSGNHHFLNIFGYSTNAHGVQLGFVTDGSVGVRGIANNSVGSWREFYTTGNTTKDAQGNLRAASPIVKVFADHIETNDESEGVKLEKLGVGRYKLKGVLGMNSDASWGGFNGGIVIPKGINGLELVWADYKVLADGDIILETHYRKHSDLPPPVVLNRLIAYPEFMDENGNELESYTPCDIPNGHWIDIRVQMPSNSIYNQKQAEAERLAKIEAERLAEMDIDV